MPPPPFDHDALSAIFAEVIQTDGYQGFSFTPDGRGAVFNNGPDDTVELRPMQFSIQAKMNGPDVLTTESAEAKVIRIFSLAADKLNVTPAFMQCVIQIVAEADAPGGDAKTFVADTLMHGPQQATVLGEAFFGGAVRFRDLREHGTPDEDDLSIEPDVNDNRLIFIDFKSGRAAIKGPIDLDQVSTLIGDAFAFLEGPTMQLLSSVGD
jgi:hypothetical protein